jgi:hypothetical protein
MRNILILTIALLLISGFAFAKGKNPKHAENHSCPDLKGFWTSHKGNIDTLDIDEQANEGLTEYIFFSSEIDNHDSISKQWIRPDGVKIFQSGNERYTAKCVNSTLVQVSQKAEGKEKIVFIVETKKLKLPTREHPEGETKKQRTLKIKYFNKRGKVDHTEELTPSDLI